MAAAWTKYRLSEQLQFQAGGEPITQLFLEFFFAFFTLIPHNNALKMLQVRCEHGYTPLTWVCYGIRLCSTRKIDLIAPCGLAVGFCGCLPFSFAVFEANVVPRC